MLLLKQVTDKHFYSIKLDLGVKVLLWLLLRGLAVGWLMTLYFDYLSER